MKKFFGAILIVASIILAVTAVQTNFSLVANNGVIDLTLFVHIAKICAVAMIIYSNQSIIVDYIACATVLISGVKPANTFVSTHIGKIDGIMGAVAPVIALIIVVLVIAILFYMAYKTNRIVAGKGLIVIISILCLVASILVGFIVNSVAASNGVTQIGLVTESLLAATITVLMVISFFLTHEDLAKIAIVIATFMTWWTILNERIVTRAVEKLMSIDSYKFKGIIPIVLGIIAFEFLKIGVKNILSKGETTEVVADDDDEDESEDEE